MPLVVTNLNDQVNLYYEDLQSWHLNSIGVLERLLGPDSDYPVSLATASSPSSSHQSIARA